MTEDSDLLMKLKGFCEINEQFRVVFQLSAKNKNINCERRLECLLQYIAREIFLLPQYFLQVFEYFPELLPKLLVEALSFDEYDHSRHVLRFVLLGNVVKRRKDLKDYALKYFTTNNAPFFESDNLRVKKRKIEEKRISDLELVEATYFLLNSDKEFFRNKWDWSQFILKYTNNDDPKVKWINCHIFAILFGMNEPQLTELILTKVSDEIHRKFSCVFALNRTLHENSRFENPVTQHPVLPDVLTGKTRENIVDISGIYLPVVGKCAKSNRLEEVPSTWGNLRRIALGLSSGKGICLQGPVGSGKTSLVEFLAGRTGRKLGESFVKVQLGDETDSKMLLGTYRCTDVPGEFVWQPGVLTQAVVEGNWLLLEDIDSANMDIASLLTGLLENRSLSVPGYRDSVPVAPGFQLFVTQRLLTTITGHHKRHTNATTLLEKHLLQITIDPLTDDELKTIAISRYPTFTTISDRLINVFRLFSRDGVDGEPLTTSRTSRLVSVRDFFKWCARAVVDFDVKSQASALKVLQDAIDVFCCSQSDPNEALSLAKDISTQLGIVNHKAEYFFTGYKPNVQLTGDGLVAGRAAVSRKTATVGGRFEFTFTRPAAVLLERIMCCVSLGEPVLLVGETGTGKTSAVQFLAATVGQKLVVVNMNQQSDSADLLGGFKPVDHRVVVGPVRREFEEVFCDYFQVEPNRKYLANVAYCFNNQRWSDLIKLMQRSCLAALDRLYKTSHEESTSKKHSTFLQRWQTVKKHLAKLETQLAHQNALAFAFVEGSLVRAVENGDWVLLDEINLANAETLECLSGLLEGRNGSLCLLERGDKKPVKRHPNFTLFACMNPSTDVGKKDLPAGLRSRFTEFFVDELTEKQDLTLLVGHYLDAMSLKSEESSKIVEFYVKVRQEASESLCDGLGHKPHFSLRSLCRALRIAAKNPCGVFKRSLYEAFCLGFLTQLDRESYGVVERLIARYMIGSEKALKAVMNQPIPKPQEPTEDFLQFEGYWVKKGPCEIQIPGEYILTASVRKNLKDLVRIVSIGKLPVLLQGDTSVGKTSLITYLARSSGNKCVRINNHEHTDLQEYIGSYVADQDGKLSFREGVLVEAMRHGHWIILDELNLAPTDVLEALNRVLDDNRELYITETQETVKAHKNFMLFATQNPPGLYGGRKMLSRAFRNRFVELHFDEIPPKELEFILHKRCEMAPSYAKKMINVMTDLQRRRRESATVAGKQSFITLRDLFRWGERYRLAQNRNALYDWDQHLADEGYLVLAGRVRKPEEKNEIIQVLQKQLKRDVVPEKLFTLSSETSPVTKHILEQFHDNRHKHGNIVWTYNTRQLAVLVSKALEFKEPVLLVGETGGGKTTVCKVIADNNGQELVTVNCHMHTESSDFIGGLRPVRDHSEENSKKLFEWMDGPLLTAMTDGHVFLADEISLADDSVLERLNSLLEPERSLLLAEKGIDLNSRESSQLVVAHSKFVFIGTMNPGGDFGKKELSPALRNRFTEIWCESCTDRNDLIAIVDKNVKSQNLNIPGGIGTAMMDFLDWFKSTEIGRRFTISVRDILTWVDFVNVCPDHVDKTDAYIHGACLTFLDSLGSGVTANESSRALKEFTGQCLKYLARQMNRATYRDFIASNLTIEKTENTFGIRPFHVETTVDCTKDVGFSFVAPTTVFNALRLLRGMQLNKAILLEGSPGVGKTSLVTALAKVTGHEILRINLSDQTDISDLFGADLPVEGGREGQFSWRDGPLLQALKKGSWILLDELNLASQSVLEGLNACLDHRGEIFVPELGKTFHVKPGTKIFACQNPLRQGGSRRGLPRSFLNRFIQVFVGGLTNDDFHVILSKQFPHIPPETVAKMIEFNAILGEAIENHEFGHKGAPWECNLRDLTRWCEAASKLDVESTVTLIYADRMRGRVDKERVVGIFGRVFGREATGLAPVVYVNDDRVCFGDVWIERARDAVNTNVAKRDATCLVLRSQLGALRSLAHCVNMNWMCILVGNSGTGKNSLVKTLSELAGKTLKTLSVTSAMDTTDILGGFEQTDYSRHLDEMSKTTEKILLETLQNQLVNKETDKVILLLGKWEAFLHAYEHPIETEKLDKEKCKTLSEKLHRLSEIWNLLAQEPNDTLQKQLNVLQTKFQQLNSDLESIERNGSSLYAGGKFEWVDSVLIQCLQDGSWLLVDNVNLCSAAVLDRLNALLEPNGVLTVSERGVDSNGRMVEVKPHPDFRLFFAMDPKNGEISRAMRNRGVEIYLLDENESEKNDTYDLKSLINQRGLKQPRLIEALVKIHSFVCDLILSDKPRVSHLLECASLISRQLEHGVNVLEAFTTTIVEVYHKTRSPGEFNCNDTPQMIKMEIERVLQEVSGSFDEGITLKTSNLDRESRVEKIRQQTSILKTILEENPKENDTIANYLVLCYSITSKEDLKTRREYLKIILRGTEWENLSEKLEGVLNEFQFRSEDFPVDFRWLENVATSENAAVLSLFTIARFHTESLGKNNATTSLLDYMHARASNRIQDKFHDVLVEKYLDLLRNYDDFLIKTLRVIDVNDKNAIRVLRLTIWRFFLQERTSKDVKKLTGNEQYNLLKDLAVHYEWFHKYAVSRLRDVARCHLPDELRNILDDVNARLSNQFSCLQKMGGAFQKWDCRPPPLVNAVQLETVPVFNEICARFDLRDERNDVRHVLNAFKSVKSLKNDLVEMKRDLDYEFSDERLEQIETLREIKITEEFSNFQVELVPLLDYFTKLQVRDALELIHDSDFELDVFRGNFLVPPELEGLFLRFKENGRDARLVHEIYKNFYAYSMRGASVKPWRYLGEGEESDLSFFGPVVTYFMGYLLVPSEERRKITLGNFRAKMGQYRFLCSTIWRNFYQLSEEKYDYMTNEIQQVFTSCNSLLDNLKQWLGVRLEENYSHKGFIDECISRLNEMKNNSGLGDPENELEFFVKLLRKYSNDITKLSILVEMSPSEKFDEKLSIVADLHELTGYMRALLNSKLPPIDPLAKKTLKKSYCCRTIESFANLKKCYENQSAIFSQTVKHPYCALIDEEIRELEEKNKKLEKYVAIRSEKVSYKTVYQTIQHGFSTVLSPKHIFKTISTINYHVLDLLEAIKTNKPVDFEHSTTVLRQHEASIPSYECLIREWNAFRAFYPEVTEPLLANVSQFLYGFKLKLSAWRRLLAVYQTAGRDVQRQLTRLVALPSLDDPRERSGDLKGETAEEKLRLLKCRLQESFNSCVVSWKVRYVLEKDAFLPFGVLLEEFVAAWNEQEEEREEKKKESESLYKIRTKCEAPTESEEIQQELHELFPSYHDIDFADMQKDTTLKDDKPPPDEADTDGFVAAISVDDVRHIATLHTRLMRNFTKTEWLNAQPEKNVSPDFVAPLMEKYKLFRSAVEKSADILEYSMDKQILGSLSVLLEVTRRHGNATELIRENSSPTRSVKKTGDFYKDPDVEEVKSSYHILEGLRVRIEELLEEWPDQPTLKTIHVIIERIYNFEITSPLSRFLTGFEILLGKCHEWEQVAHSGVSLSVHSQNLIQQIIVWRKLELNMWKDLLNRTFERMNEPLYKWWLYMYNVMKQFVMEKRFDERELIETLQTFITKSNLAEFEGRLELILVFHCHSSFLDRCPRTERFRSVLWNLYAYFRQFEATVVNKIKELRAPVDKKLRDYVKIVRWKDVNYWTIKETVDKSRKTLHKCIREFKDVLNQPVSSCLVNLPSDKGLENVGIWDRPQRQHPKTYHYTLDAEAYMAKQCLPKKLQSPESDKLTNYFLKSRKLCKEIIEATRYPGLIQTLDTFVTEIIESSTRLQNLQVDTTLPKNKQKSQAKSILRQKQRALAELFQVLSKMGLSFRTGVVNAKLKDHAEDFLAKPIDLNASFAHRNYERTEEKILTIWHSCESYYNRCLLRSDVLETALKSPAPDLGVQNVERCKGYQSHLLTVSQRQKEQLITSSRCYYYLKHYQKQMQDFCDGKQFLHLEVLENTTRLLQNVLVVMSQCKIVLNTCPVEETLEDNFGLELPLLRSISKDRIKFKDDEIWTETMAHINNVITMTVKLSLTLQKCKNLTPSVEEDLLLPKFVSVPDLKQIEADLEDLYRKLDDLKTKLGNTSFPDSISWLIKELVELGEKFKEPQTGESNETPGDYEKTVEKLSEKILLVVQNLYKKYNALEDVTKKEGEDDEEAEHEELQEEHLKKLLEESLTEDLTLLDVKNVLKKTRKVCKIFMATSLKHVEETQAVTSRCLPLLDQMMHLLRYFLTQQVSSYRVTCKLNSILLNIFIDLASKGFCVPPEFSDELQGEGESKPSDGLGLGEGQGERDVSDKIESEDQLDEAQPAGQEKEKEEDKDCKEEENGIEMSEDFDSKLQDKEKNEEEEENDDNEDSGDSDAEEQMGETGDGADKLDQEIWGDSDEENVEENEKEGEEKGDGGEKEGKDELGAKEDASSKKEEPNDKGDNEDEKEKKQKEINEMDEPEYDDEQTDPYHGNQPELPEPEAMDLPDDLQLDDGEENDNEPNEENPFDVDKMKEDAVPDDQTQQEETTEENEEKPNDEAKDFSSDDDDDDEEFEKKQQEDKEQQQKEEEEQGDKNDTKEDSEERMEEDSEEKEDAEGLDQSQTNEDRVEAMETDTANAADKTEAAVSDNQSNQPIEETCQEDNPDKEGVGQSQMEESATGHSAQTSAPQEMQNTKNDREEEQMKKRKPGETDSKRSLGDVNEPTMKKLKTIGSDEKEETNDKEEEEEERTEQAEMYQHIQDAEGRTEQVTDVATKEQAEQQKDADTNNEKEEEEIDSNDVLRDEEHEEDEEKNETLVQKPEKPENKNDKQNKNKQNQHPDGDVLEEINDVDIDGDTVATSTVARSADSFHQTLYDLIRNRSHASKLTTHEIAQLRADVEQQLSSWHETPSTVEAEQAWQKISSVTSALAQDLSEQLRLVLEPTQASRLRGDYRTGRRINMRKVIPYIASQFRKDKIWLRRTRPSKRDYQIVLAIDDSSSMADNRSREMAFESVALVSRALTLLEAGQLSVLSFGERTEVVHKLSEQFSERSGVKLLQKFQFEQQKTCVGQLVDFAVEMLGQSPTPSDAPNAKLLVIVSDGRGVFSEGETYVRQAVRRAKLADVFMVYVILDNPENKSSVLDIRMPVFVDGKLKGIENYMDAFPFPFYVILREISALPNVLSDALRQWFELVSGTDR